MSAKKMQWFEIQNNAGLKPKWKRMIGLDANGGLFCPAAIAGDELKVMIMASYDGVGIAQYANHVFVPVAWIQKNFSDTLTQQICCAIQKHQSAILALAD